MPCKSMWKMVRLNSWNICSEMFWKVPAFKFLGKHVWWRPLLTMSAASILKRYWGPNSSQMFSYKLFDIKDNSSHTRWTTVISFLLRYHAHCGPINHQINTKVLLNVITYYLHHCQWTLISQYFSISSFWHLFSFFFPVRRFFLPWKPLIPNHGLSYLDSLRFFSISPSFRIQSLGIGTTASYLNHFSRT